MEVGVCARAQGLLTKLLTSAPPCPGVVSCRWVISGFLWGSAEAAAKGELTLGPRPRPGTVWESIQPALVLAQKCSKK